MCVLNWPFLILISFYKLQNSINIKKLDLKNFYMFLKIIHYFYYIKLI
jgi:hypothetical protein